MGWRPFLPADATGISHLRQDNGDGTVSYKAVQENDPILDRNAAMRTHNDGYTPSREMRRVASIPMQLLYHWQATEGWDPLDPANADRIMRKLNDPDYAYLRTADGQLGMSNGVMR